VESCRRVVKEEEGHARPALLAGLTTKQIGRLAALRVRARRGADGDGYGTSLGSRQADRRHGLARWLVETGRLSDDLWTTRRAAGPDRAALPGTTVRHVDSAGPCSTSF
jgi:hypothetical protein